MRYEAHFVKQFRNKYVLVMLIRYTTSECLFTCYSFEYLLYAAAYSKYTNAVAQWQIKYCETSSRNYSVLLGACASWPILLCLLPGCDFTHIPSVVYTGMKRNV